MFEMELMQPVSKCQKMSSYKIDDLPDELILEILSFMNVKEIIKCGQVSKRIRSICSDETLWQKVNLYNKIVPVDFLIRLVDNKCKYLRWLTFLKIRCVTFICPNAKLTLVLVESDH